ncbi:MAG: ligase-associated DNA damage response endonuclease PdeM [Paracoccaceae bacterium]
MNGHSFTFHGAELVALASGGLFWPAERLYCVADLHLGKSERIARGGGSLLPPYETRDTLARLDADLAGCAPKTVLCLGDSFDDLAAAEGLDDNAALWLTRMMAGRRWIWIAGNHDPAPVSLGGGHHGEYRHRGLSFRHIATPEESGEISGHYHPKIRLHMRGASLSGACFLLDAARLILPSFGTFTGGLRASSPELDGLMGPDALALVLGRRVLAVPMRGAGLAKPG